MTVTTSGLTTAMRGLHEALDRSRRPEVPLGTWRWTVRQRMAEVRDALVAEAGASEDGWLAARGGSMLRERNSLLSRLSALGPAVLEAVEVDRVCGELRRLLVDIAHHAQRLNDLAYDEVELELGGSE